MPQLTHNPVLHAALPSIPAPTSRGTPGRDSAKRSFRILVVDDNVAIHDDFRKVLCAEPDSAELQALEAEVLGTETKRLVCPFEFAIDSAYQGVDGVDCVRRALQAERPYALAFVDMRMPPGQDGLKTVLDAWSLDPEMQVVICSAFSDYSWQEISRATGETDQLVILRKPFDPTEVLQLTHALCRKWEVQRALRAQVGRLEELVAARTREVEERQALFQLILENATDLIAVVDPEGRRIYNSPSYYSVMGYTPEELQATHAFAQIHPDDLPLVNAAAETARTSGKGEMIVYRKRHRDGSWRMLESCAGAVQGADGQLAYLVIVSRDVTQRREMELKEQLGQKLESIGRLASGIAHEINTPTQYVTDNTRFLNDAFRTMAQIVQQYRACRERLAGSPAAAAEVAALAKAESEADLDFVVREIPEALQQNLQGLSHISRIVGSLKEFSYPNSPEKAPTDLNRAIETAIGVSRHEWKYVAEVKTDLQADLPPVPCIVDEFNQVMLNLLVNAAHAIADALKARHEPRGLITVRTALEAGAVRIEVSDTGTGIHPELQSRVFEPFFTTKQLGKGTGQGLAIVHAIVVQHHRGNVDFVTEVGRGTTFRIWLPLN